MRTYGLLFLLLTTGCARSIRCNQCQPALADIVWGFHEARMEASLRSWERGEEIDGPMFMEDVEFFEGVTGLELTNKNYFGVLPSSDDKKFFAKWRSWYKSHKASLEIACTAGGKVSLKIIQSRAPGTP